MVKLSIGLKVKEARELSGLTQQELADKISMSQSYINQIESGKASASLKTLEKIAIAFNIESKYFLEQEPGVLFGKQRKFFTEAQQENLVKLKTKGWITLMEEFEAKDLTPEEVREAFETLENLKMLRKRK